MKTIDALHNEFVFHNKNVLHTPVPIKSSFAEIFFSSVGGSINDLRSYLQDISLSSVDDNTNISNISTPRSYKIKNKPPEKAESLSLLNPDVKSVYDDRVTILSPIKSKNDENKNKMIQPQRIYY